MAALNFNATRALDEAVAETATAVMANGNTIFTIAGGPIQVVALISICIADNDITGSTVQYQSVPTVGAATVISGASGSLASLAAGATVSLAGISFATAPLVSTTGPTSGPVAPVAILPEGTIKIVIGTGSTTGTWKHYLRYRPLAFGVLVS